MTLKPGYGLHNLHLQQKTSALLTSFGGPVEIGEAGTFRAYWLYPDFGFDCMISVRTERILSLFLGPSFSGASLEEFAWNEDFVKTCLQGSPEIGGGFDVGQAHVDRWLSYDAGIGFHFTSEGAVSKISIFRPKRKAAAKVTGSIRHRPSQDLAALRLPR